MSVVRQLQLGDVEIAVGVLAESKLHLWINVCTTFPREV